MAKHGSEIPGNGVYDYDVFGKGKTGGDNTNGFDL